MKTLKISILVLISFFILSCGGSDDCTQLDWVGTYTGTATCDGIEENATVTITADGTDRIVISYETPTVITNFTPAPFESCNLNLNATSGDFSATLDVSLDGDDLSLTETIMGGGDESVCIIEATRN